MASSTPSGMREASVSWAGTTVEEIYRLPAIRESTLLSPRPRTARARSPPLPAGPSVRAGRSRLSLGAGGGGSHVAFVVLEDHPGGREDVGGGVLLRLGQADRVLGAQQVAAGPASGVRLAPVQNTGTSPFPALVPKPVSVHALSGDPFELTGSTRILAAGDMWRFDIELTALDLSRPA